LYSVFKILYFNIINVVRLFNRFRFRHFTNSEFCFQHMEIIAKQILLDIELAILYPHIDEFYQQDLIQQNNTSVENVST